MVLRMSDEDYAAMRKRTPQGQRVPPNNEPQASAPPPRKRLKKQLWTGRRGTHAEKTPGKERKER